MLFTLVPLEQFKSTMTSGVQFLEVSYLSDGHVNNATDLLSRYRAVLNV